MNKVARWHLDTQEAPKKGLKYEMLSVNAETHVWLQGLYLSYRKPIKNKNQQRTTSSRAATLLTRIWCLRWTVFTLVLVQLATAMHGAHTILHIYI